MTNIRRTTTWLLLSLLAALPAFAQDETPSFGEIIDVRVINLEVVVTDDGARVSGLGAEDFRLLIDGKEVPIEYFTEVEGGHAVSPADLGGEATMPALRPGEAVGTRYLVFIDDVFTIKPYRNRVLRELASQLPALGPDDHMAVVAFDGSSIDMLSSWSNSAAHLERVFEQAQARTSQGLRRLQDRRFDSFGYDSYSAYRRVGYDPRYYVGARRGSRTHAYVEGVITAAASTLRGFAKPPGRKVMLLLSGGWPNVQEEWTFDSTVDYRSWQSDSRQLEPLVDTANRLGYTLYPIDVKGLESRFAGAEVGSAAEANLIREIRSEREWMEEGILLDLARETGGQAFLDGARLSALERVMDDTRSYYWLGFTPDWREDDARHRIKMEVRDRGLKVRTRKSFSDLSRQTEVTMMVESAQLFDLPLPSTADFKVTFGEPQGGRKVVVPLFVEIPLEALTLLPGADGYTAQLELRIAVTDDRGHRADIPVIPFEVQRDQKPASGETAAYQTSLRLRRRPHQMLISIYDRTSGEMLSKVVDLSL